MRISDGSSGVWCSDLVGRIRAHLEEVVRVNKNWDGRVVGLQVTELYADQMELRALVSAADAGKAFDLRCDVREAIMAFIAGEIGRASCRERVCQYVSISVAAVSLNKKKEKKVTIDET